jgi:hypothetical protein
LYKNEVPEVLVDYYKKDFILDKYQIKNKDNIENIKYLNDKNLSISSFYPSINEINKFKSDLRFYNVVSKSS